MIVLSFLILFAGFFILIKSAGYLVDGSSSLAKTLNISNIAIGLTVVAFGTSAPELVVNIFASIQHKSDMVFGNIIGSNIFNILFVLGVSGLIRPLIILKSTIRKEIPFALLGSILLLFLVNDARIFNSINILSRFDGLLLFGFFILFIIYAFRISKVAPEDKNFNFKKLSLKKSALFVVLGIIGLCLGGKVVIDSSVSICRAFNISEKLISLTVISIGTSLPELVTSIVATFKRNNDIAVGNVVGSNIFNIFAILGISAVISPLPYNCVLNFDILVMIIATLFLFIFMFIGTRKKLDRWQAFLFLVFYVLYVSYIYFRN